MNEVIREKPDYTRIALIRQLYAAARNGTIEEFAAAFDRCDAFRAGEIEVWRQIAIDAVNCRPMPICIVRSGE